MSVALTFTAVGRRFITARGPVDALRDVHLEMPSGSRTAILGPSGSGKSTLLHIAAGLDTDHSGTVDRRPPDARIGCVFQEHRLLPWATCADNVGFALRAAHWPKNSAQARAAWALDLVGLADCDSEYPGALSGGMRQRVALARAIAVRPGLLLLDEPFGAVNETDADGLARLIKDLSEETGCTVLLVTHRVREACQLADRTIILTAAGRIGDRLDSAPTGPAHCDSTVENSVRAAYQRLNPPLRIDEPVA